MEFGKLQEAKFKKIVLELEIGTFELGSKCSSHYLTHKVD